MVHRPRAEANLVTKAKKMKAEVGLWMVYWGPCLSELRILEAP